MEFFFSHPNQPNKKENYGFPSHFYPPKILATKCTLDQSYTLNMYELKGHLMQPILSYYLYNIYKLSLFYKYFSKTLSWRVQAQHSKSLKKGKSVDVRLVRVNCKNHFTPLIRNSATQNVRPEHRVPLVTSIAVSLCPGELKSGNGCCSNAQLQC